MHNYTTCITIANVSTLKIRNLIIEITLQQANVIIKDCCFIMLNYLQVKTVGNSHFTLLGINIMNYSYLNQIILPAYGLITLLYNETYEERQHHVLSLDSCKLEKISIDTFQKSYILTLKIVNTQFDHTIIPSENLGRNKLFLINCQFIWIRQNFNLFTFGSSSNGSVKFINCHFENNRMFYSGLYKENQHIPNKLPLIKVHSNVNIELNNCSFYAPSSEQTGTILQTHNLNSHRAIFVIIKNTTFIYGNRIWPFPKLPVTTIFTLSYTNLHIEDSVVFRNVVTPYSIISLERNSSITIAGSVEFSYNCVNELINFYENEIKYIIVKENSVINITHNEAQALFAIKPTIEDIFMDFAFSNILQVIQK